MGMNLGDTALKNVKGEQLSPTPPPGGPYQIFNGPPWKERADR